MSELLTTDLTTLTTVELRKLAAREGIKGQSSGRKADLLVLLGGRKERLEREAAEVEAAKQSEAEPVIAKRGTCTECGRKEGFRASGLCDECREYAEWENTHSDENHEVGINTSMIEGCPVCYPELDGRKARKATATGRSRAGMVIVAKGSEIHKSMVLKAAAEAIGWTVEIERETYELADDATGEGTRYYATATKGDDSISLAWDGRAYDYPASSAKINGKDRKVRNLKEALRLL